MTMWRRSLRADQGPGDQWSLATAAAQWFPGVRGKGVVTLSNEIT